MKNAGSALLVICMFLFMLGTISAQDGAIELAQAPAEQVVLPSVPGGMHGRISLDLRNIDIVDALKFVAMKADLNIVTTRNVAGRVTLMVENVPVKDIFDIMLRSNGLAYSKEGEIYNVMTENEYKEIFGKNFADIRVVKAFRLEYAIPEQAFSLVDTLKSSIGRVLVEPDSGTVIIMDTPEHITQVEKALSTLERKNVVRVFNLEYAMAKDVEKKLKAQLDDKKVGSVEADERSNQVIVQTFPERMGEVERLIAALDQKTKEVLIDTTIIKVKLSDRMDTGIEWEGIFNVAKNYGMTYFGSFPFTVLQTAGSDFVSRNEFFTGADFMNRSIGALPFNATTSNFAASALQPVGKNMHLGIINTRRDFDMLVNYLNTLSNTQILSNPKLAVVNNQEASIHVGERQAYVTSTTTTGQTTSTVSEEVTFVDIGIKLSVTPTINDEGFVTLKIKPEVSSVVSTLETPSGNRIPIIDTSMAETTVMVKDGSSIVIGGLRKDDKIGGSEGVPFFKDIPFIGFFFESAHETTERTELLVMITPHIIAGDKMTTGDESDFAMEKTKEYKEYPPFTPGVDVELLKELPESKIKSYREYGAVEHK